MKTRLNRSARATIAACVGVLLMVTAACSSGADKKSDGEKAASKANYPVTIKSSLGEVTIDKEPQRIVTLGWGSTDIALALDVVPVGIRNMKSDSGTDDGLLPWVKDKLGKNKPEILDETSKSIPFEKIAALKPDLILAVQSGLTADQYAQLSNIAKTVAYPGKAWQTSWQDQTTIIGQALGKPDQAKKLIDDANAKIAKVAKENPQFKGKTIAVTSGTATDGMGYYFDTDPRIQMLAEMGFTPLPQLAELRKAAADGKFSERVSWENVPQYSPDILATWFLDESLKNSTEGNPVFQNLAAVQKKAYVPLTDPPLVYAVSAPNVLNLSWLLDRYVPELQKAVKASN